MTILGDFDMADIKSPEERSRNMAKIRSKDTKPEVWLRKQLFKYGYRYRKNVNTVPGHPDVWLAKYNTALFVHGCFWHRHEGCKFAYMPKSRVEFWETKFHKNIERDIAVKKQLADTGIRSLIIWECTVKKMMKSEILRDEYLMRIIQFLESSESDVEL